MIKKSNENKWRKSTIRIDLYKTNFIIGLYRAQIMGQERESC